MGDMWELQETKTPGNVISLLKPTAMNHTRATLHLPLPGERHNASHADRGCEIKSSISCHG